MWPAGHPNRSYRSRCRKAVSRSSRNSRLTTRRPSQRHSGLAAGPPKCFSASANSSAFFAASFASAAGGFSVAFGSTFCADVGPATHSIATLKAAARRRRLGPYMVALNYEALPADWPPHTSPFGQHCGEDRGVGDAAIKTAARCDAKTEERATKHNHVIPSSNAPPSVTIGPRSLPTNRTSAVGMRDKHFRGTSGIDLSHSCRAYLLPDVLRVLLGKYVRRGAARGS